MISVVCFDLGGVLIRLCRSFAEAVACANLPVRSPEHWDSALFREQRGPIVKRYQLGQVSSEQYFQTLSELSKVYSPAELERVHLAWTRSEYPGIGELVDELNRVPGMLTACLSNTNQAHWVHMHSAAMSSAFPSVRTLATRLASHLLGLAKPDERVYRRAETEFGAASRQILFFDDVEENVLAAREAGWHAEAIDPASDTSAQIRRCLRRYGVALSG